MHITGCFSWALIKVSGTLPPGQHACSVSSQCATHICSVSASGEPNSHAVLPGTTLLAMRPAACMGYLHASYAGPGSQTQLLTTVVAERCFSLYTLLYCTRLCVMLYCSSLSMCVVLPFLGHSG